MYQIPKLAVALTLFTALAITANAQVDGREEISAQAAFQEELVGLWQSVAPEFSGETYSLRTLDVGEARWSIQVEVFGDEKVTFPLFTLNYEGPYEITGASRQLDGAFEGTFIFDRKYLTLQTEDDIISDLGFDACSLTPGEQVDVSAQGCSFVEPIEECSADYDLLSIEGGFLYPGARTESMCNPSGRPTERGFQMKRIEANESSVSPTLETVTGLPKGHVLDTSDVSADGTLYFSAISTSSKE